MDKYLLRAKRLTEAGFWVAGRGHFDITVEEIAQILKMLSSDDFCGIKKLYDQLSKERL